MSKTIYRYNPQTLSYERVTLTRAQRVWLIVRQLLVAVALGGIVFAVTDRIIDSPSEKKLKKENALLEAQYKILERRISENQKVLDDLQKRDDEIYRAVFDADPIPMSVRRPGSGGINRYEALTTMPFSDLVISTTAKLDMMSKQLYVQSNSYDELTDLIATREERIRHIPAIQPISVKDLTRIGSGYGMRLHPVYGKARFHTGLDLNAPVGTPIYATGDGTVESAKWNGGYGNCVVIDHGFGFKSLYGHCRKLLVKPGQKVKRGQEIATVGSSGVSTGPHCHYEVIIKGQHDNPAKYFFMDLTPEEYEEMLYISETH